MADESKSHSDASGVLTDHKEIVAYLKKAGINDDFVSSLFRDRSVQPWPSNLGKYVGLQVFGDDEMFHSINIINGGNLTIFDDPLPLPVDEITTFSSDPSFKLKNFLRFYNVKGYQQVLILKKNSQTNSYDMFLDGKECFYGYINKRTKKFKIVGYQMEPKIKFQSLGVSASSFELTMNDDNSALYGNASIYKFEDYDTTVDLNEIYTNLQNLIDNSKYQSVDPQSGVIEIVQAGSGGSSGSGGTGDDDIKIGKQKRDLWFHVEIEMINNVDSKTQCFDALFTIYYEWTLTTSDFYKYAAMPREKGNKFEPDWKPNLPRFPNAVDIKLINASNIEIISLPQRLNSYKESGLAGKRLFYATQNITVRGTFTERLELKFFPFDCQDLKVYIETNILDKECNVHPLRTVTRGMSPRASVAQGM